MMMKIVWITQLLNPPLQHEKPVQCNLFSFFVSQNKLNRSVKVSNLSNQRIQSTCWLSGWIWFSISSSRSKSAIMRWRWMVMCWYCPSWAREFLVESVPNRTKASSSLVSANTCQGTKDMWGVHRSWQKPLIWWYLWYLCPTDVFMYLTLDKLLNDFFGEVKGRLFTRGRVGHGEAHIHAQHQRWLQEVNYILIQPGFHLKAICLVQHIRSATTITFHRHQM